MFSRFAVPLIAVFVAGTLLAQTASRPTESRPRILVFSKTAGFRHESIPAGVDAIRKLGAENGFDVDATEDAAQFNRAALATYAAVVFLNTTCDVLNEQQQSEFEAFIRGGKGFVGVHAATDTEYGWEWYGNLVGARFASHPAIQRATVNVTNHEHPSTKGLPDHWQRIDEWYNFDQNPRKRIGEKLVLLASVDEATYSGGSMAGDHPVAWCHEFDGGRAWYTACGHTIESYSEPEFLKHVLGGILWAARIK